MLKRLLIVLNLAVSATVPAQAPSLLQNGGFEALTAAVPGAAGWELGDPPQIPSRWVLNPPYPGRLAIGKEDAHGGERYVSINAALGKSAHLYQMCTGLKPGTWYRVSAWVRGGPVAICFYEYFNDRIGFVAAGHAPFAAAWHLASGFYQTPTAGYRESALALTVAPGQAADVDDVGIEPVLLPDTQAAPDLTLETDLLLLRLSGAGTVREVRCKPLDQDFAAPETPVRLLTAVRNGMPLPLHSLTRDGDLYRAQFLDPEVRATLRLTPRARHILFEVLDVQPGDVESLTLEVPVRRLRTLGWAFNATYDDEFGICLFGATANVCNRPLTLGKEIQSLGVTCGARHGMKGAKFALAAAPRGQFNDAIMEAERENGLPCPVLEGKWARFSEPVRRSYLFMVDASEASIDKTIEYAKIGRFGTIIFLKDNWLANHGHYDINRRSFPNGRAGLKEAVRKIHAAGLGAGVHVFGPSISPNDPYVSPKPDPRLGAVTSPPLAAAIDEKATAIPLAAEPDLPAKTPPTASSPDQYLQVGDEIVRLGTLEAGPPWRFINCQRGACGTRAAAHPAGTATRGLLMVWGFFMLDPDSTLADEVASRFAEVFNECDFDMVYFDASDGMRDGQVETWYYLNKMHLGYYRRLKKDVLYQTSNGTGSNLTWHIVPRSASADGHGDLKGYLDERLACMLGMADNFTRSDVGWYYMFKEVRPDQIEYVCAKTIGIDGSISIETSLDAMESHPQGRQMLEMLARYEQCRLARFFPDAVREKLREPQKDFKLFSDGKAGWTLWRAAYEEPRFVDALDGQQNVWMIDNPLAVPCRLGVEVTRGAKEAGAADYNDPKGVTIESFDDLATYQASARNDYERYVQGGDKTLTPGGAVRVGVAQTFTASDKDVKVGPRCAVFRAENGGGPEAWGGIGRRFDKPLDLAAAKALGLWIHGDGKGELIRVQLWDTQGRYANWLPAMSYKGWRLHTFPLADAASFDWGHVEYLLFYFNSIPAATSVEVRFDDLRALPALLRALPLRRPALSIGEARATYDVTLQPGQGLTDEGPGGTRFWPGSMRPAEPATAAGQDLDLKPGENTVTFSADVASGFPVGTRVLLYRLWPMAE